MSEETNDASRTIPLVVLWAVAANALMLIVVGITFIFCLGDLDSVLNSPTGQPMIQVFYDATQSQAGTGVMVAVVIVVFVSACVGQVATASRQMWSFARDQGKPQPHAPQELCFAKNLLTKHFQRISRFQISRKGSRGVEYSHQCHPTVCHHHLLVVFD